MDSALIYQAANEIVQSTGTRNIKQIALSCNLDITETHRITDTLGLLSLYFEKPLVLINRQLNKQTKQMVCGYALGHCLERQMLTDLHTFKKFLTIKDKHIFLYEQNAITSHLVLVKLLELHHLGYDLRHYHEQHHAFIEHFKLPRYFRFDAA